MRNTTFIAAGIAGASVAAFMTAEFGLKNGWGWSPTIESAIYLALLSIVVAVISHGN
jgi:hypothetical protein